jgi:hypothetical protein
MACRAMAFPALNNPLGRTSGVYNHSTNSAGDVSDPPVEIDTLLSPVCQTPSRAHVPKAVMMLGESKSLKRRCPYEKVRRWTMLLRILSKVVFFRCHCFTDIYIYILSSMLGSSLTLSFERPSFRGRRDEEEGT